MNEDEDFPTSVSNQLANPPSSSTRKRSFIDGIARGAALRKRPRTSAPADNSYESDANESANEEQSNDDDFSGNHEADSENNQDQSSSSHQVSTVES